MTVKEISEKFYNNLNAYDERMNIIGRDKPVSMDLASDADYQSQEAYLKGHLALAFEEFNEEVQELGDKLVTAVDAQRQAVDTRRTTLNGMINKPVLDISDEEYEQAAEVTKAMIENLKSLIDEIDKLNETIIWGRNEMEIRNVKNNKDK